ncbi:MAG: hypothetical protein AB1489_30435, partial [Acidobacteriota bacterium]
SQELGRSGNFQGANISSVLPPTESPNVTGNSQLSFTRAQPPTDSPVSNSTGRTVRSGKGYRITDTPALTVSANAPSDDQLFDFATGDNQNRNIRTYLDRDPAANKAVSAIQSANREIGSPDQEPQLDQASLLRLDEIAKELFRR